MKHKMRRNRSFEFKNNEGKIENEERGKRKIMSMMIRNDVSCVSYRQMLQARATCMRCGCFDPKKSMGVLLSQCLSTLLGNFHNLVERQN